MSVQQRKILALKNPFGGETAIVRVSAEQIKLDLIKEQNENLTLLFLKNDKTLGIFYGETSGSSVIFSRESLETVGDFQIENEFEIRDRARIVEIIHSDDKSGRIVYPTFEAYEEEETE